MTNGIEGLNPWDIEVIACLGRVPKLPREIAEEISTRGSLFDTTIPISGPEVRQSIQRIREALVARGMTDGLELEHDQCAGHGKTIRYSLSMAALRWVTRELA